MWGRNRCGRHSRNWVRCYDLDNNGFDEYEILYEQKATKGHGLFGVIENCYRSKNPFYVVWRANRNTTRDTTVMRDPLGGDHAWYRGEAVGYETADLAAASIDAWDVTFEYPDKRKRYGVRDAQKSKFYRWEHVMVKDLGPTEVVPMDKWPNNHAGGVVRTTLSRRRTHDYLQSALEHICINLGESAPELKFRTGGRCSYGGYDIRLLPSHCNLHILIHELAHVLHKRWKKAGSKEQAHGAEYAGIFAYLMIRFGYIDRDAIVKHATTARVKMVLPDRYWDWEEVRNQRKAA